MENINNIKSDFFLILSEITDRFPGLFSLIITLVIFVGIIN